MRHQKSSVLLSGVLLMVFLMSATGCEPKSTSQESSEKEGQAVEATAKTAAKSGGKALQVEEVQAGEGVEAKKGDTVAVNYTGTLLENGKKFDSSYDRNEPIRFKLGAHQVIEGWEEGIQGMKKGGKRVLVIPPEQAYGKTGYPPVIPPNATLRFEVELVGIE
jgi:FKBP-type peptidyl-prolyl cis-trans isomerase FkpA